MPYDTKNLDQFPTQPGVYLMKDEAGEMLYVGKESSQIDAWRVQNVCLEITKTSGGVLGGLCE